MDGFVIGDAAQISGHFLHGVGVGVVYIGQAVFQGGEAEAAVRSVLHRFQCGACGVLQLKAEFPGFHCPAGEDLFALELRTAGSVVHIGQVQCFGIGRHFRLQGAVAVVRNGHGDGIDCFIVGNAAQLPIHFLHGVGVGVVYIGQGVFQGGECEAAVRSILHRFQRIAVGILQFKAEPARFQLLALQRLFAGKPGAAGGGIGIDEKNLIRRFAGFLIGDYMLHLQGFISIFRHLHGKGIQGFVCFHAFSIPGKGGFGNGVFERTRFRKGKGAEIDGLAALSGIRRQGKAQFAVFPALGQGGQVIVIGVGLFVHGQHKFKCVALPERAAGHLLFAHQRHFPRLHQHIIVGHHMPDGIFGVNILHACQLRAVRGDVGIHIQIIRAVSAGHFNAPGDGGIVGGIGRRVRIAGEIADHRFLFRGGEAVHRQGIAVLVHPPYLYRAVGILRMGNGEIEGKHFRFSSGFHAVAEGGGVIEGNISMGTHRVIGIFVELDGVDVFHHLAGQALVFIRRPVDGIAGSGQVAVGRGGAGDVKIHLGAHGVHQHGGDFVFNGIEGSRQISRVCSGIVAAAVLGHGGQIGIHMVEAHRKHHAVEAFKSSGGIQIIRRLAIRYQHENLGIVVIGELRKAQIHALHDIGFTRDGVDAQAVIAAYGVRIGRKISVFDICTGRQMGYQTVDGPACHIDTFFIIDRALRAARFVARAVRRSLAGTMYMVNSVTIIGTGGGTGVQEAAAVVRFHIRTGVHGGGNVQHKHNLQLGRLHFHLLHIGGNCHRPFIRADAFRLFVQRNIAVLAHHILRLQRVRRRIEGQGALYTAPKQQQ